MAGTGRLDRPSDAPRPGAAGGGGSPARWDDDGDRVEGLAVSSPRLPSLTRFRLCEVWLRVRFV